MRYTITPFYNANEKRVKFAVSATFDDGEQGQRELYADAVKSPDDLESCALAMAVAHDKEKDDARAKETEASDALTAALASFNLDMISQPKEIGPEKVAEYKAAPEKTAA